MTFWPSCPALTLRALVSSCLCHALSDRVVQDTVFQEFPRPDGTKAVLSPEDRATVCAIGHWPREALTRMLQTRQHTRLDCFVGGSGGLRRSDPVQAATKAAS
ncbi:hypothetical protein C8R47DRAFT_1116408, partial [Mycena vitilis]